MSPSTDAPVVTVLLRWRSDGLRVLALARARLRGRDLALVAAGLTFFAGVAVVPLLLLALALTGLLTSSEAVRERGRDLAAALPDALGAREVVLTLVDAGAALGLGGGLLALLPMSLYGEGLRRALLRFAPERDDLTGWRGRLLVLPVLLATPVLLDPLLRVAGTLADLAGRDGPWPAVGAVVLGFYAVLAALVLPLGWTFRVVAAGALPWRPLVAGTLFTAACLSGFLQGFVLFLALPLDLGAPFGGLTVVGAVVAVGLWMFLLHVVLLGCWVLTRALDRRLSGPLTGGDAVPARAG